MHTIDKQREQLVIAGITQFPPPDLTWLDADLSRFALPDRFAVLVPGASPTRPAKRWPVAGFAELAAGLGLPPVIIGTKGEAPLAAAIRAARPDAIDLSGRTALTDIAAIGRRAGFAVGNDTGPMHLLAACGCPGLTLFGGDSDPALCAPRGAGAAHLRRIPLSALTVAEVRGAIAAAGFA
jgi:ADP-heptose:LPS heptosyltransferase